jgi:3-oxoadipate enol-lactonase
VRGVADHESVADELTNITLPTLVAGGAEDVATPPVQAERIENARLEMVAGAGHSSTLEQTDAVSQLLGDFLGSVDGRRP